MYRSDINLLGVSHWWETYCRRIADYSSKSMKSRNLFSAFTVVYEPTTVVYEPVTTSDEIAVARMSLEPWTILQ